MAVTNSFTDTIAVTYTGNGKSVNAKTGTYTGTKDTGVAGVVPAGTEVHFDVTFPFATIQSMIMACDQDVEVNTNDASGGGSVSDGPIALKKTAAIVWASDHVEDKPFTAIVTKVYVKNTGTVDAKFDLRVLYT